MKRLIFITLALMLLATACTKEPATDGDRLYEHYASRTDLTVAQVRGFQLADSVKVDVVILVADDSATWQGLKEEMNIRTSEGVTSWMGAIDEPARRVKRAVRPAWRAMAVHADRTVAFYRIDTEAQRHALLDYQMNHLTQQ